MAEKTHVTKLREAIESLEFPTGSLLLQDLIDRFPGAIPWNVHLDPDKLTESLLMNSLVDAVLLERELACLAVSSTETRGLDDERISRPGTSAAATRGELVDLLSHAYVSLGLASGRQETEQMVRRFERDATSRFLGEDRRR